MIPTDQLIAMSDDNLSAQLVHYRSIKAFWDDADRAKVASLVEQLQVEVQRRAKEQP